MRPVFPDATRSVISGAVLSSFRRDSNTRLNGTGRCIRETTHSELYLEAVVSRRGKLVQQLDC